MVRRFIFILKHPLIFLSNAAMFVRVRCLVMNLSFQQEENFASCSPRVSPANGGREGSFVDNPPVNPVPRETIWTDDRLTKAGEDGSSDFPRVPVSVSRGIFEVFPWFFPGIDATWAAHATIEGHAGHANKRERSRTRSFRLLARMSGRTKRPRPALPFRESRFPSNRSRAWKRTCLESRLARTDSTRSWPLPPDGNAWPERRFLNPGNRRT